MVCSQYSLTIHTRNENVAHPRRSIANFQERDLTHSSIAAVCVSNRFTQQSLHLSHDKRVFAEAIVFFGDWRNVFVI